AGRDRRLRLGAALEQPPLNQQLVGTAAHRSPRLNGSEEVVVRRGEGGEIGDEAKAQEPARHRVVLHDTFVGRLVLRLAGEPCDALLVHAALHVPRQDHKPEQHEMPDEELMEAELVEIGAGKRAEHCQHWPGQDRLFRARQPVDDQPQHKERDGGKEEEEQRRRQALAHARFTASVASRPSASNTLATIALASSPAVAYMALGESWSWKTSGSTIERTFSPRSSTPASASACIT